MLVVKGIKERGMESLIKRQESCKAMTVDFVGWGLSYVESVIFDVVDVI